MTVYVFEGIWNIKVGLDGEIALGITDKSIPIDIYEYLVA